MDLPVANLRPAIAATRSAWQSNLDRLFEDGHFILGDQVREFEQDFASAMGGHFAIGVASGTAAVELCLRDSGIVRRKQRVLTSALTAPFTAIAILAAGATPQFADVDPLTLQIDPEDAANRMTRQTAALLPVHLYGQPCAMRCLAAIARSRKVALIQDACQAHGAMLEGRPLPSFSPYVAYSFYPTKNLGCLGDGGAIVTNSEAAAQRLRMLRDGGRHCDQVSHLPGVNARLDEMQACFLRAFLPQLREWNCQRARIASLYDEAFGDCQGIQRVMRTADSVHHLYVVRARKRDALQRHLSERGIGSAVHYPVPLHLHPSFACAGLRKGDLPHAEKACREILSLPLWPYLKESDALRVADLIRGFYER
jgi:dTDP-3-amino-3,4,6-trideoxy-alpha-D-glucose transaminase